MATIVSRSGTPGAAQRPATRRTPAPAPLRSARDRARAERSAVADAAQPPSAPPLSQRLVDSLGVAWTRGNPVWTHQALGRMRALQQRLLEGGLPLPADQRGPLLRAVAVVEAQVQLRLRLEQHRGMEGLPGDEEREDESSPTGAQHHART